MPAIPFLTTYDPPGSSEGTLDPLGLSQIADQLATRLVPAVRERMQRVRFLTAMAIGGLVTKGLDGDPDQPEAQPFLVWEWLAVEAIVRALGDDPDVWGVRGTPMLRQAAAVPTCGESSSTAFMPSSRCARAAAGESPARRRVFFEPR